MNMTEAMREQFEAAMKEAWGSFIATRYDHGYAHDPENCAWQGYQAALRSPAVAGLVEALRVFAAYPLEEFSLEGKPERKLFGANDWELMAGQVLAARAALAQYATLAGESR